jgi:hypothetical protein
VPIVLGSESAAAACVLAAWGGAAYFLKVSGS